MKRCGDHVIMLDGGIVRCTHCGASYPLFPEGRSRLAWEMNALSRAFGEQHAECAAPEREVCAFCSGEHASDEHVNATTTRPTEWLNCGDTGLSSRAIYWVMCGAPVGAPRSHPVDPDDFGRCYRLLHAPWAASWRERIGEMAARSPEWRRLSGAWNELEALYELELPTGKCPRLYARMQELLG